MASFKAVCSMKKALTLVVVVGILFSGWLVYARHEARRAEAKAAQAKRDAAYQAVLAQFQRSLQLGTSRADVRKYLDSQNTPYGERSWDIVQKIGEDPGDSYACDRWSVFVALKFNRLQGQKDPSPFDNLGSISIEKMGHCL
jgi:hypothetical protein